MPLFSVNFSFTLFDGIWIILDLKQCYLLFEKNQYRCMKEEFDQVIK
jgi:hypothetical protein